MKEEKNKNSSLEELIQEYKKTIVKKEEINFIERSAHAYGKDPG